MPVAPVGDTFLDQIPQPTRTVAGYNLPIPPAGLRDHPAAQPVAVADDQLHPVQAPRFQAQQELPPAREALPVGQLHPNDAPPPFVVDPDATSTARQRTTPCFRTRS
jgi:hypothetical protein